jgi:hypothetical protein
MRVRQGFQVDDANDFARYVMSGGMTRLMIDSPQRNERLAKYFPYDGRKLYEAANRLRMDCCAYFAGRTRDGEGTSLGPDKSDLERIEAKLDAILFRGAKRRLSLTTIHNYSLGEVMDSKLCGPERQLSAPPTVVQTANVVVARRQRKKVT